MLFNNNPSPPVIKEGCVAEFQTSINRLRFFDSDSKVIKLNHGLVSDSEGNITFYYRDNEEFIRSMKIAGYLLNLDARRLTGPTEPICRVKFFNLNADDRPWKKILGYTGKIKRDLN